MANREARLLKMLNKLVGRLVDIENELAKSQNKLIKAQEELESLGEAIADEEGK